MDSIADFADNKINGTVSIIVNGKSMDFKVRTNEVISKEIKPGDAAADSDGSYTGLIMLICASVFLVFVGVGIWIWWFNRKKQGKVKKKEEVVQANRYDDVDVPGSVEIRDLYKDGYSV